MAQPSMLKFGNVLDPNPEWVAKVKEAALEAKASPAEKIALFPGTASRAYKLALS